MPVQHICLRRIGNLTDARMPKRLSVGYVVRHEIFRAVARKQQLPGRGQQAAPTASAVVGTLPYDLPCGVVDRREKASARSDLGLFLATETHRSPRVYVDEIEERKPIILRHIYQSSIGRVRRRLPVSGAIRGG